MNDVNPNDANQDDVKLRDVLLGDAAVNWHHRGRDKEPGSWGDIVMTLGDVRFLPVALIRIAAAAATCRVGIVRPTGKIISLVNRLVFGVECATQTVIGPGLYFPHTGGIVIGAERIGARCVLYHQVTLGAKTIDMPFTPGLRPKIGDDVVLAAGSKILGGVTIDDHAVVGANAVVVHDVPAHTVVGGVPAVPLAAVNPAIKTAANNAVNAGANNADNIAANTSKVPREST